ncbi:transcriptional regulator [Leptolyngbya sp. 'hensonii']|uniref:response regulator n=1 Tax=Leptolyngbya sp. 'hensonii' TaxID=1922337 RepID=UPI00094FED45|nr:response regulator [Leptolyngbya sp. 'hensonii']OLP18042.1 transcriptional regulator [Leptolyngbya sp. 'hensonii']
MRILLVEDDEGMLEILTRLLSQQNYVVDVAQDGESGWELVEVFPYDLVLLDVMLPRLDGISFCRRLRDRKNQVLVMLLTARDTTTDKLMGLDSGADDYVVKPFNVQELAARIRALLRRGSTAASPLLTCGGLCLDPNAHEVTYGEQSLQFSRKEYLLLELFLRNQSRVYSYSEVADHLWSLDVDPPTEATIRTHIKNIRRELKAVGAENLIETMYGQGYRINPEFVKTVQGQPRPEGETGGGKQTSLDLGVSEIWQQTKGTSFERVVCLEQATQALKSGTFDRAMGQLAVQSAHKLAGSLGMFGFETGSTLARQLETLFQAGVKPKSKLTQDVQEKLQQQVEPLVVALRRELEGTAQEVVCFPEAEVITGELAQLRARILAVDDDPQVLILLQSLLEPLEVQFTALDSPTHFWEVLQSAQPDLLLLDINMPGMSGFELCRSLRQNQEWNWLPVLLLTARTDRDSLQQAFLSGADDYVIKPIAAQELLIRLLNRLRRAQTLTSRSNPTRDLK